VRISVSHTPTSLFATFRNSRSAFGEPFPTGLRERLHEQIFGEETACTNVLVPSIVRLPSPGLDG